MSNSKTAKSTRSNRVLSAGQPEHLILEGGLYLWGSAAPLEVEQRRGHQICLLQGALCWRDWLPIRPYQLIGAPWIPQTVCQPLIHGRHRLPCSTGNLINILPSFQQQKETEITFLATIEGNILDRHSRVKLRRVLHNVPTDKYSNCKGCND